MNKTLSLSFFLKERLLSTNTDLGGLTDAILEEEKRN